MLGGALMHMHSCDSSWRAPDWEPLSTMYFGETLYKVHYMKMINSNLKLNYTAYCEFSQLYAIFNFLFGALNTEACFFLLETVHWLMRMSGHTADTYKYICKHRHVFYKAEPHYSCPWDPAQPACQCNLYLICTNRPWDVCYKEMSTSSLFTDCTNNAITLALLWQCCWETLQALLYVSRCKGERGEEC